MLLVDFDIWIRERGYIRIAPTNEYDIKEFTGYARWEKEGEFPVNTYAEHGEVDDITVASHIRRIIKQQK